MVRKEWGRIINIGGIDAYWGLGRPATVASKLGLVGLTRALANEVARFGITANVVVPGAIDSVRREADWFPNPTQRERERDERIPIGRLGKHDDVAAACAFLASPASGYITGQELFVSGGAHPLVRFPETEYPASDFFTEGD